MTLLILALAWLTGAVLAALDLAYAWPLLVAAAAGTGAGLALTGSRRAALACLAIGFLAVVGLWRYESERPPDQPGGVAIFNEGPAVELRGVVTGEVEERERSQRFSVRIDATFDGNSWQKTSGSVLVTTRLFPRFDYGDAVELRAKLETPPAFEGFDYREYLARQGIVSVTGFPEITRTGVDKGSPTRHALNDLRRPLSESLARSLPEPEASLARGILLGERATIPSSLTADFNAAGISHLVAISGYNVMLLAGFSLSLFSWLTGRRWAVVLSMALVLVFALFVGATPSVLRAALMAVVTLGAVLAGRPGSGLTAVCLAAAVLVAADPLIIDDVGFQLSFAATIGIVTGARPLQMRLDSAFDRLFGSALVGPYLTENVAITTVASIAVLPVIAMTFGQVSLVALPANLLAGFVFPLVLAASALTAFGGAISADLGRLLGEIGYLPLAYLVEVGGLFAAVPFASFNAGRLGAPEIVALTAAVVALISFVARRRRDDHEGLERQRVLRLRPGLAIAALLLVVSAVSAGSAFVESKNGRVVVSILDVGQGDAILIETPRNQRILIDGGPSGSRLLQALGHELPPDARRLDLVVLTHAHDDHVTGLVDLLDRFDVDAVLTSPLPSTSAAYDEWVSKLQQESAEVHEAVAGEWIDLGNGVRLEVLNPQQQLLLGTHDDLNNNSVVLRLVYGDVSFLLTGDLAAEGEAALLRASGAGRTTVLKAGHHGSDTSTTAAFLAAMRPDYVVISTGAGNTFGHPSPTLQLRLAGIPYLRTDENGTVRFETDGRRLWADYDRGGWRRVDSPTIRPVPRRD